MAKRLARLLLLSAALLAARAQEDGDVEAEAPPAGPTPAFLVISKAVKEEPAVVGGNVTVTLQMYNAGESPAVDISLRDAPWEGARLTLLDGAPEVKVASLGAGASATHTYVLRAQASGVATGTPATAQYRDGGSKASRVAHSALAQALVVSRAKSWAATAVRCGAWASLGVLRTEAAWLNFLALLALLGLALLANQTVLSWRETVKRHKRRKASAELGVKAD